MVSVKLTEKYLTWIVEVVWTEEELKSAGRKAYFNKHS